MKKNIAIHWFRQDLRLSDNPGLAAASTHDYVMPIYILDDHNAGEYSIGRASRWWLHHSLQSLRSSLHEKLSFYMGDPLQIIMFLIEKYPIQAVYWNRCYEPWCIKRDQNIKEQLMIKKIIVKSYNGSLLWEPWDIKNKNETPYKVFGAFYRKGCLKAHPPRIPIVKPKKIPLCDDQESSLKIEQLGLLPANSWSKKLDQYWHIGEKGAHQYLNQFLTKGLNSYKDGRNYPSLPYTSRLSPYIHFGEISPNQIWYQVRYFVQNEHCNHFCSELGWREFSYHQLFYNPALPKKNIQKKFDDFPWEDNQALLKAWQKGQTGIPMVDAGIRELWQTGYMHNRVRMIVGSFLVKNLLIHWHHGEKWFWDCLLDADLASNSANWQWIAGCGADATPYFRIFNPILQGQKFDPEGQYIRHFVPELAHLPNKYLFSPWEAPESVLTESHVKLGINYPKPIIDLQESRNKALQAFQVLNDKKLDYQTTE